MGLLFSGSIVRSADDDVPGVAIALRADFRKFLVFRRHAVGRRVRDASGVSRLDVRMGRLSKGERRMVMTRVPRPAGQLIEREVRVLRCHYSDYIAYALCQHAGVPMDLPIGNVVDHPEPREAPGDRVEFKSRVPVAVADVVLAEADRMGVSIADHVGKILCDRLKVPFEPRVKKKALKAWATAGHAGEAWSMTG